uniref:Uncharacterized protein n=1 Tax=Rhodosorus marinus TaxID=101924 RepID=A0A7S3A224_9RHOD|mmetsp:Transcript_39374/g.156376  ORF Transcript_39374/g.156376 Transcript_39374/m.156376 type:complete len:269 (+) Transcript_39374:202-1008(+)
MVSRSKLNENWQDFDDEDRQSRALRDSRRGSRFQARAPVVERIRGWDNRLLLIIVVLVVTAVFFSGIRNTGVELTIEQLAELERRVSVFHNTSIYAYDVNKSEGLLSMFTPAEWAETAKDVDYVAFVYDDVFEAMNQRWIGHVHRALAKSIFPGFGIALFSCGCIVPSIYFEYASPRFDGAECMALPAFVFDSDFIFWIKEPLGVPCHKREGLLETSVLEHYEAELETAKENFAELLDELRERQRESTAKGSGRHPTLSHIKYKKDAA